MTKLQLPAGPDAAPGTIPLVMAGGNLDHDNSLLAQSLTQLLSTHLPGLRPIRPRVVPAVGAALLSLSLLQ